MSCTTCFTDRIGKCETALQVYAQLLPLTDYTWVITDKFGHKYDGAVTTDVDGFFSIPVADLPAGLLTPYSGDFKLEVMDSTCKPIKFKMASEYDCVIFDVFGGSLTKENIGCDFTCAGESGAQSVLIPFADVDNVSIDWSTYSSVLGNNPVVQVYVVDINGIYNLTTVEIQQVRTDGILETINIDLGGIATGYIILS